MQSIDYVMTNPLIGAYIGFTSLILINIFTAILTNTVNRVWETSVAFVTLQRALMIVNEEKSWSYSQRKFHNKFINEKCCPYIDENYNDSTISTDNKIEYIENKLKKRKQALRKITTNIDQFVFI